ncbi:hypothetical protein Desku_3332 [Desulfofundulus kuznetsovii DSM 6115]|uniref:Uncharacterized protein n=1 Tax=Desulfofundulus kuznetsovii (strain DSM 6115 / VKM B-1805 / 17) TaxID=760568 RepID=A0AAU8PF80_DESK7|nr:hypothetical protein Desku_3332 [Desulfofundulus kuznetsovii DSM 6115]
MGEFRKAMEANDEARIKELLPQLLKQLQERNKERLRCYRKQIIDKKPDSLFARESGFLVQQQKKGRGGTCFVFSWLKMR